MEAAEEVAIHDIALTQGADSQFMTQAPRREARGLDDMDSGRIPEEALFDDESLKAKPSVPRIYYATRTHSQIAQVANELKITGYTPKMAILGGRKHYCINETVREAGSNLDEACKDQCASKGGCKVYKKEKIPFLAAKAPAVYDIEDLVKFGKRENACPFYISRTIFESAELVFCPYNYIVDPAIRSSMKIDITGAVVIFDEAHNIEDAAREAASIDITIEEVEAALTDSTKNMEHEDVGGEFRQLYGVLSRLKAWMHRFSIHPEEDSKSAKTAFEGLCRPRGADITPEDRKSHGVVKMDGPRLQCVWSGGQIRTHLSEAGLDPASNNGTRECIQDAKKALDEKNRDEGGTPDKSGTLALTFLESLMGVLTLVYGMVEQGPDASAASDFRLVVSSWKEEPATRARSRFVRQDASNGKPCVQLSLWCMNPACAFREIGEKARSVIVTSGTLSPMISFASELGIPFPGAPLTTGHVVPQDQVRPIVVHLSLHLQRALESAADWRMVLPMVIARSPRNHELKATFQDSNTPRFQNGVIEALQSIAQVVPHGMLVFMPSYGMLNKLVQRWEENGSWKKLRKIKPVWKEPQGGSPEALEESIQEYYEAIKDGRGGIFFAVCRGKVSEGINFADDHARAVVLIGIPYPAYKDTKVEQKKAYNDHKDSQARGLVTGSKWYNLQAFRAMNQALGRCIRHKQDYGAIILMDERMLERNNQSNLSEWVRNRMGTRAINFDQAHRHLDEFFMHCKQKMLTAKEEAKVKDEKSLFKDEKFEIKDEKLLVKDEKPMLKDEKEVLEAFAAGQSTQELWAPSRKQRITVAQALPSTAAMHNTDAAVDPKMEPKQEEHDAAQCAPVATKQEQDLHDTAPNALVPKPEPAEDDDLVLVASKPIQKKGAQGRSSKMQTTLLSAFAAPQQTVLIESGRRTPASDPPSRCQTPDPKAVTPSGADTAAEQNSAPNGQSVSFACAGRCSDGGGQSADSHAVEVSAKQEPKHTEQPILQLQPQHTAQQPYSHAPLLDAGFQDASMADPPLPPALHTPWHPAQATHEGVTHGCHAPDAAAASPLSAAQSQACAQTPLPANLGGKPLSTMPVQGSSIVPTSACTTSAHWDAAQQPSWPSTSLPVQSSRTSSSSWQPPTKSQKLNQPGDVAPQNQFVNASALHPADAQLLESGFLDSDSEEDATPAQPGSTSHANAMPSATAPPLNFPLDYTAQPTPPMQGHVQQAPVQSWTPGPGPPMPSPVFMSTGGPIPSAAVGARYGAASQPANWVGIWRDACVLLSQHDTAMTMTLMIGGSPTEGVPPQHATTPRTCDIHSILMQVLDEACKNAGQMSAWCGERLQRGGLPIGVAMVIRHADNASNCTETHRTLDLVLSRTNAVVADDFVRVMRCLTLPRALQMLHASYKSSLESARGQII